MNEIDWWKKKTVECFGLFSTLLYINLKNNTNIACTDFVNVNIALNLFSYKEN